MAEPTIKAIPNGPYRVSGPINLTDSQGNVGVSLGVFHNVV